MLMFKYMIIMVSVWCCCCVHRVTATSIACATPQYARIDQMGIIQCSFSANIYSIYWYDTRNSLRTPPIIRYEDSLKNVDESKKGEFDLFLNGSLKILRVSMDHEKYFRVLYSTEEFGNFVTEDIQLLVTVEPIIGYPLIDKCYDKNKCFAEVSNDETVLCSVSNIRPAVNLMWIKKSKYNDTVLQSEETISEMFPYYTSKAELSHINFGNNLLQLLICKAEDVISLLAEKESIVLLENTDGTIFPTKTIKKNIEVDSHVVLPCNNGSNAEYLIWKAVTLKGNLTTIARVIDKYFIMDNSVDHLDNDLWIHTADVTHSGLYICVYNDGIQEEIFSYELYVYVKPTHTYPIINECKGKKRCRTYLDEGSELRCSVERTRPALRLSWALREGSTNQILQSQRNHSMSYDFYYTSSVTTSVPPSMKYAMILVCASENDEHILVPDKSAILIENNKNEIFNNTKSTVVWVEVNTELRLMCGEGKGDYIIWKRKTSTMQTFESLLYTLYTDIGKINERFETTAKNELLLSSVDVEDEGTYVCIHGNGKFENVISSNVHVYVTPSPEYLVVEGCENQQYCVLNKGSTGDITCSAFGIRPEINLEWRTVHETSKNKISFYDREVIKSQLVDTFNVVLKSSFRREMENVEKVTIECKTTEPQEYKFSLTTTLDILFSERITSRNKNIPLVTIPIIIAVIISAMILVFFVKRQWKRRQEQDHQKHHIYTDEMQPLRSSISHDLPDGAARPSKDLLDEFIKALKFKYEDWCAQIQPIPNIGNKLQYKVGQIFIDRTLRVSYDGKYSYNWSRLNSYNDIFKQKSKRIIIEADPGYGKSTMILQAAKDWCTDDPNSSLKDVDIFILLRLKMLQGVTSIFKAIKVTLLPKDTPLTELHIQQLLRHCKSVVIALDDFDEYPDKEVESDFKSILKGDMLQGCKVVLLTRISILPIEYHSTTTFMQLNGFSDESKHQYINKIFGNSEGFSLLQLTQGLPLGIVIHDILKVPLFFTMMVHINEYLDGRQEKEKITSVTALFKTVMPQLEGRLKQKFVNVSSSILESETLRLGKVALNGLIKPKEGQIWEKSTLIKEIGETCFKKFVIVGILVEEKSSIGLEDSFHGIPNKAEETVKFFHFIFCQWYASLYLATRLEGWALPGRQEKLLRKLNPFDLQYLYLFTCGVNEQAANKIIQYLESGQNGDEFSLLCTLEKTGDVGDIKEQIKEICNETVSFYEPSSRLLRKSTALLLEIASNEKVPIKSILIDRCYALIQEHLDHLGMNSGMVIPPLVTLEELVIYGVGRRLTVEETKNILLYVSKCDKLHHLSLQKTFQPYNIDDNDFWIAFKETTSKHNKEKTLKIEWSPFKEQTYILNIDSRRWTQSHDGNFLTEENYEKQSAKYGCKDGMKHDSHSSIVI